MTPEERQNARASARAADLAEFRAVWEGSPKYGMGALLEALNLCVGHGMPLPRWLAKAVRAELIHRAPKRTLMHYRRWREVRRMRDTRPLTPVAAKTQLGQNYAIPPAIEIGYEETFRWVANRLEKELGAGAAKAIKRSYALVENDLPEGMRYRRTYTKRSR
jgi:hypothetical protein